MKRGACKIKRKKKGIDTDKKNFNVVMTVSTVQTIGSCLCLLCQKKTNDSLRRQT
jgi:hypothetical protein